MSMCNDHGAVCGLVEELPLQLQFLTPRWRSRYRAAHANLATPARSLRLVTLRAEVCEGVPALRVLSTRQPLGAVGR